MSAQISNRWPERSGVERILEKLTEDANGCLIFGGYVNVEGYGVLKIDGRTRRIHRLMYEAFVGPVPAEMTIDHLCRNRACGNPAHMEVVTRKENVLRGVSFSAVNAAKTHCSKGHPYDEENTYVWRGARYCRACGRERRRAKQVSSVA